MITWLVVWGACTHPAQNNIDTCGFSSVRFLEAYIVRMKYLSLWNTSERILMKYPSLTWQVGERYCVTDWFF